jgi:hypothetical protein
MDGGNPPYTRRFSAMQRAYVKAGLETALRGGIVDVGDAGTGIVALGPLEVIQKASKKVAISD